MTGESRLFLLRIPTTHLGMRPLCRRSLSLKAQWIEQAQSMPRTGGACLRRRAARRHQDGRIHSDRCRTSLRPVAFHFGHPADCRGVAGSSAARSGRAQQSCPGAHTSSHSAAAACACGHDDRLLFEQENGRARLLRTGLIPHMLASFPLGNCLRFTPYRRANAVRTCLKATEDI